MKQKKNKSNPFKVISQNKAKLKNNKISVRTGFCAGSGDDYGFTSCSLK